MLEVLEQDATAFHVVAEIGHNHQGDFDTCLRLIDAASDAGANSVKLQKRENRSLFTPEAFGAPYASPNAFGETYGEHREALEFDECQYQDLMSYAQEREIELWATAFDTASLQVLLRVGVKTIKIASGDLRSLPLLREVAMSGKEVVVSTGGGSLAHVRQAVELLESSAVKFAILQCTAAYPAPYEALNLQVISEFRRQFPSAIVGYSGHENGIAMPLVAYALGAQVIEKHFTLDRTMKGTDHSFSLEPVGLRKLVRDLRRAQVAMGSPVKAPLSIEEAAVKKMGKSIVATEDLEIGHEIRERDLEYRSPGSGMRPDELGLIVGKRVKARIQAFDVIQSADLE